MRAAFITIGNPGDDPLPQDEWATFVSRTRYHISTYCTFAQVVFLGEWQSTCDAGRQSVCWAVELSDDQDRVAGLREALAACGARFRDAGVAWGVADVETLLEVPVC